jgi:hypothetical protein
MGSTEYKCRPSQPVYSVLSLGLPTSITFCASKCERVVSVEPLACTKSIFPSLYGFISSPRFGFIPNDTPLLGESRNMQRSFTGRDKSSWRGTAMFVRAFTYAVSYGTITESPSSPPRR